MAEKRAATAIRPGVYTYGELLNAAGVDFNKVAAADYNPGGIDFRKVSVGGLTFDNLNNVVRVSNDLEIRADGKVVGELKVDADGEFRSALELPDDANSLN